VGKRRTDRYAYLCGVSLHGARSGCVLKKRLFRGSTGRIAGFPVQAVRERSSGRNFGRRSV
jgi:hypothetical protein